MSGTVHQRITKLASSKRSRPNLGKVQDLVSDLEPAVGNGNEVLEALEPLYRVLDDLDSFEKTLTEAADEFELLDPDKVKAIVAALRSIESLVPEQTNEQSIHGLAEAVNNVENAAEEYESSLEESGYTKEDREEMWDGLTESLTTLGYIYETA